MSAIGGKEDMGLCGNPLSRSLSGVKRTCPFALHMSAYDPKRTSARPPQETNPSLYDGCSVLGSCWLPRPVCYSTGASNCAHHFGRARAGTFAEQLILHDCVSHANRPLLLTVASGAAAALAAGDDNEGGPEGAAICGPTGPATGGGSFLDKSPVAHPASNKTSNAGTFLMTFT
jgi:hypothetical protein